MTEHNRPAGYTWQAYFTETEGVRLAVEAVALERFAGGRGAGTGNAGRGGKGNKVAALRYLVDLGLAAHAESVSRG